MVLARLRGFCSCVFSIKSGTCFPSRAVFGSRIRDHKQGSNLLSSVSVLVLFFVVLPISSIRQMGSQSGLIPAMDQLCSADVLDVCFA